MTGEKKWLVSIDQLLKQITDLVKMQNHMKKVNKYYRRNKTCKGFPGISDERAAQLDEIVRKAPPGQKAGPYNPKELNEARNLARRLKAQLQKMQDAQMDAETQKEGENLCTQ